MIESIRIQDEACYGCNPQYLDNLSQHNFIFGTNGTGKTTISRIIANENAVPHCSVIWKGGTKLETLVYNRDFVDKNFDQSPELKGIFTLGEKDKNASSKIAALKTDIDSLVDDIQKLNRTLEGENGEGGKRNELAELETKFEAKCWALKQKHDEKFQGAFAGFRNKKSAFKNKLLSEAASNSAQIVTLEDLERRAETIFGETPESKSIIPIPRYDDLLELGSNPILTKRVVGKTDVDIAAMIQKLGNSDWVKRGRDFYEANDKICPFCQQVTDDSFAASLNEYFDETFEADAKAIEQLNADYRSFSERLSQDLKQIMDSRPAFLNIEKLETEKELLDSKIRTNLQRIQSKQNEPSRIVQLDSLSDLLTGIKAKLDDANKAIEEHNEMVSNLAREKRQLTDQVWKYLLEHEIKSDLAEYKDKKGSISKAIESLLKQIDTKKKIINEKKAELRELEKGTTSIQPTIDEINLLLISFGFNSFTLAKSERERYYKIIRPDGSDAKETLSEGEKNFITFLYFYHLLKGSEFENGMTSDRVVVFDDPVSSLDSDVLFIVSTLIKGLFEKVRAGIGHIKQVFVLTHNVYFHKEVSFNCKRPNGGIMNEETFWTVKKLDGISVLEQHNMNPIKTTYELLWMEVRNKDSSIISIQNIMRRILENYFTILGNINPDEVCSFFEGKEKLICKSLFSWVNAGSHFSHDDLYISGDGASVDTYRTVFRKIFEKTRHEEHYKMMMRECETEE